MKGGTWTYEEEQEIVKLLREGKDLGEIAGALDRSLGAIEARIEAMAAKKQRLRAAVSILVEP